MKVMAGCPQGDIRTRGQTGLKLPPVTQLEAAPGCNQKLCLGKELAFKACLEDPRGHLINILSALEISSFHRGTVYLCSVALRDMQDSPD